MEDFNLPHVILDDEKNLELKSFSIQLKFPRGQKIPLDFRTEHAQSQHLKNHTEKDERKKKLRILNFLGGFSRKKIINQSNLSET